MNLGELRHQPGPILDVLHSQKNHPSTKYVRNHLANMTFLTVFTNYLLDVGLEMLEAVVQSLGLQRFSSLGLAAVLALVACGIWQVQAAPFNISSGSVNEEPPRTPCETQKCMKCVGFSYICIWLSCHV